MPVSDAWLERVETSLRSLLERIALLEEERDRLSLENQALLSEQSRVRAEIDRILARIDEACGGCP